MYGSSSTHWNGTTIVLERSRPSVAGPSMLCATIASSTVTRGDRQVLPLRVRNADPDLPRLELDPPDVEPVGRRGRLSDEVEQCRPARGENRHRADEQQQRQERPQPPAARELLCRRVRQSTTSKNPIQPSSVNSDWCAWNMNRPVFAKSISMIPRWPWQSMTVSVYSKWSLEPVG